MTRPKRHHFVPVSYLERFVEISSDRLFVLDLKKMEIRKQKPNQVMVIGDYYRQTDVPNGIDEYVFEKGLGQITEPGAKIAIDKLLKKPSLLDSEDRVNLIHYLELQRIRVPRQINRYRSFTKQFVERLAYTKPDVAKELVTGKYRITIPESSKFFYMKHMTQNSIYGYYFMQMEWRIWDAPKRMPFITTDNPVSLYHPLSPPPYEAGIGLRGTKVFFPLSPKHLLELVHPGSNNLPKSKLNEEVAIDKRDKIYIHIKSGRTCPEDLTYNRNWILTKLADKYVVSNEKPILLKILKDLT